VKALLIQPPVYDTQYYPEWSMPSGLLKISSWLRTLGYDIRLLDCLFPDKNGEVKQRVRSVVQVCSTLEWPLEQYREMSKERLGRFTAELPHPHRYKYEFGMGLADVERHLRERPMNDLLHADKVWVPDEVWITSIMTYWWESTRDTVRLVKRLFPHAKIRVGGIYPTLAPHHLRSALKADGFDFELVRGRDLQVTQEKGRTTVRNGDCIVTGEVPGASECDLDFECYRQMTRDLDGEERLPRYAILMTSRGCPFDCSYCAQKAYNEGQLKVRFRRAEDTFAEIKDKYKRYRVHEFAFYEDNFLLAKANVEKLLRLLLAAKAELPHLKLYAPEGVEVRLLHQDLAFVKLMKDTGFQSVYLPLETLSRDATKAWNRRHSHAALFEKAVKICHDANFKLHEMELNAFILFGMPGEKLQDVVNTMFYASEQVGGLVPMLFTPVPGSIIFEQFKEYLLDEMGFDLHHLNGKLYPFLAYNAALSGVALSDYEALESLAFRLNAKTMGKTFQLDASNSVYRALRNVLAQQEGIACPAPVAAAR
jgi:biotin synthase-like enzyme